MSSNPTDAATTDDSASSTGDRGAEWESYSDFKYVSYQISKAIQDAIDAYATLKSLHDEGSKVRSQEAARARSPILSAAMQLLPELEHNKNSKQIYRKMVENWTESGVDDDGYIDALQDASLQHECPTWLYEFVYDLRKAGWELGYLQAGRYEEDEKEDDARASARAMLQDIYQSK